MALVTWKVYVDFNNDGDFSDSGEDISDFVFSVSWQLGFSKQFDPVARDSTAEILLDNRTNKFSPEHASAISGLTWGRRVKIESTFSATTRTHQIVRIASIVPAAGPAGPLTAKMICNSYLTDAQKSEAFIPLQVNKTADQVIEAVIAGSSVYPPGLSSIRWFLGLGGQSELGSTTYLGVVGDFFSGETGKSTFPIIGDQWRDGVSILGALRDIAGREFGRIFLDRTGLLIFWNRHHFILDTTSDAAFNISFVKLAYSFGDDLFNRVTVRIKTRQVGVVPEVLARMDSVFIVPASSSLNVTFRYSDINSGGGNIGGKDIVAPVRNVDFTANSLSDGTGSDLTTNISTTIVSTDSTRTIITFTNAGTTNAHIRRPPNIDDPAVNGALVRGIAVRDYGDSDYTTEDTTSISSFRKQPYLYPYIVGNILEAQAIADFLLNSFKTPIGRTRSMTLMPYADNSLITQGLTRTIGDRVSITDSQLGLSDDYFIIQEEHNIVGADQWVVTWTLEPAGFYLYWVLGQVGQSEMGQTTYVGPL